MAISMCQALDLRIRWLGVRGGTKNPMHRAPACSGLTQFCAVCREWAVFAQVVDAGMPRDHVGLRGLRERGAACPQWHCRAWVRAWSSPVLTAGIGPPVRGSGWKRCLTHAARQGRVYPLACLIAVAVCAFTAAGNDRLTAVGQWIKRASQQDLARLRAPWDPLAGRYRAPDEKTIRVVLDRLDPRALTRALLGPRGGGRRRGGLPQPACAATAPGRPPGRRKRWPATG